MKASIFNILAIMAFTPAALALPAAEAGPAVEAANGGAGTDTVCYRDPNMEFKDPAPHALEVASRTRDTPSGTVEGHLFRRSCFSYACDDNTDCIAVGCTLCVQTHTPCGDSVVRCR